MQAARDFATLGTVFLEFTPGAGRAGLTLDRPEVRPAPERLLRDDFPGASGNHPRPADRS
jgi:hypothetical protein